MPEWNVLSTISNKGRLAPYFSSRLQITMRKAAIVLLQPVRLLALSVWLFLASTIVDVDGAEVGFNEQIRPILSKHCIACHGPDEGDRQADLRLDTFAGATEDLGGYAAVEPGDPEASEMIERIVTDDPDLRMPPPEHAEPLSQHETELLKEWIEQGAEYQRHWSFVPPTRPPVPSVAEADNAVVHNEIDPFILARLSEAGLSQSPPETPKALVRRVSLDLTGLPPRSHDDSLQELIAAYEGDPSQGRLGAVVDGLLATTAYAEHWASVWLDLARYADTVGYSGDERRDIWPWRDWLIRSLEANKSYKQMSIEMIAGDLLPNATDEQRLATAFHRNTLSNNEGGTDDEEFRTIAVKDRLSTTLNGWMGLTVRCAECHSHKYDPISHEEYYQLLDFFNQTVDSDRTDERPKLAVRPELDPAITGKLNDEIASLEQKLVDQPPVWTVRRPVEMESLNGTEFELLEDDSILATGPSPKIEEYQFTFELSAGASLRAIRLEAMPHVKHNDNVGRSNEGAFILSQIRLTRHDGDATTHLQFADAEASFHQVNRHPRSALGDKEEDAEFFSDGWAVNHPVSGYKGHHEAVFELEEPLVAEEDTRFTVCLRFDPPWPGLNMGCVRLATCEVAQAASKYKMRKLDPIRRKIHELAIKRDAPVRVPVIEQLAENRRRTTHIMLRGNFRSPGEPVAARFPEAFAPTDPEIATDRLGLAKWLFTEENPLTARVAVNRYWSRLMGLGLVETEEDFGTQGVPPSHPQLLDHLAVEFRDGGWDVHRLLKQIVMSATYQQASTVTAASAEIDPRNRLLSRGPRVRLSAEVVRDQALAVAGLLSQKSYGPPVYPPSPIKRFVNAFTGGMTWQESEGQDRNRRAIYTFLKRSSPHPLFETFDMASRDTCSFRRLRTNTPLQSFMTLNDITFIEAARALADKMLAQSPNEHADDEALLAARIDYGLERALYTEGSDSQRDVLIELFYQSYADYASDLRAAAELAGEDRAGFDVKKLTSAEKERLARKAAMTVVGNVILNLDGFLNN